ncbi:MAG: PQQ-binding-like beta-propeller repeat protein [Phycisphaerales bacterium]|nr:PQQ-binding-like beta-propeller repeat protein [Phycisphaerales bacterium]
MALLKIKDTRTMGLAFGLLMSCAFGATFVTAVRAGENHDWPGFRGPTGDGTYVGKTKLTESDHCGLKLGWLQKIGSGYSGVAVADGCAVTMFSDGTNDVVAAFDTETGKEKWRYVLAEFYKGHDGSHDGPITTPLIATGKVFALDPRGNFAAIDLKTGKEVWKTNLVEDHECAKPHYGFGTSPIFLNGVVVLEMNSEKAAVAGFDPNTGEKLWSTGEDGCNYQSPIQYVWNGATRILATCNKSIYAIDAANGDIIWQQDHAGEGARGLMSLTPVPAGVDRLFLAYKDESSSLMQLIREEQKVSSKHVWEDRSIRNSYNVPVYLDGHVYAFSSRFLTCVDIETGKPKWKSRQPGDGFLILVDGHLVIITKEGSMHIVKATPEKYEEVASLPVFENLAWAHPSYSNGSIYVRSLDAIARVDIVPNAATSLGSDIKTAAGDTKSKFHAFLEEVNAADDKQAVVDKFIAAQKEFPIVEDSGWVHFVYKGEGQDLAVAGDLFGARQESPMTRLADTDMFYRSVQIEPDARLNYLFMRDYEEITDPRNERKTVCRMLTKDMEMSFSGDPLEMSWFSMPKWKAPAYLADTEVAHKGRIDTKELDSKILETKVAFDVYVPYGHDTNDARYPVAYIHAGQAAMEHGKLPQSLDHLCGTSIRPTIAVFIKYMHRGPMEPYSDMLIKELIPLIDETYHTEKSPKARASVGIGFAGVTAISWALRNPDVVGNVATQSPFIFDGVKGTLNQLVEDHKAAPPVIYMEWGKYDFRNPHEAWDIGAEAAKFAGTMRKKGFKIQGGEVHDGTGWSSWVNRYDAMFNAIFPKDSTG